MAIIEVRNLIKRYGKKTAVDDLTFDVPQGAIFGFVGPNGAGKTSTMRILTTLMQATAGEAYVAGYSVNKQPRDVRRVIGYMPDFFGVYDDMTVWEYLDFFGACYEIPPEQRKTINGDLLELVDLAHRRDDMVDTLSRGMKQRLALARTLTHDPKVLVLDEPASGLDPRARIEIRELLVELARMGKTVFFSTHILADVAEICTEVAIVEAGKLVAQGSLEEIQRALIPNRRLQVTVLGDVAERARFLLSQLPMVKEIKRSSEVGEGELTDSIRAEKQVAGRHVLVVECEGDDTAVSAVLNHLITNGVAVLHFSEDLRNMEAVFMQATRGIVS